MAEELAAQARLHPEGYAVRRAGAVSAPALAALLRMIGGAAPAGAAAGGRAGRAPRAATLGGVRVQPAGRLGPGWLFTREAAAMAPPVPGRPGAGVGRAVPPRRRRVRPPAGAELGALGARAAALRRLPAARGLPAAVLADPAGAAACGPELFAVPQLGYPDPQSRAGCGRFRPRLPSPGRRSSPAGRACSENDMVVRPNRHGQSGR